STTNNYDGVATVGNGLPISGNGQVITRLPGLTDANSPSSYSFFFTQLNPTSTGEDTLYVADSATGITKFSLLNGTWTSNGTVGSAADQYRGLTARVSGTTVSLYATRVSFNTGASQVVSLVDSSGFNQPFNASPSQVALALTNESFRGVALAPEV